MTTTTQWKTLNDWFAEGPTEVWYMTPNWFPAGIMQEKPDRNDLEKTHILLGTIGEYDHPDALDEAWQKLQGEFWSPNGEARTLIRSKGLKHTSMSMGDSDSLTVRSGWWQVWFELVK